MRINLYLTKYIKIYIIYRFLIINLKYIKKNIYRIYINVYV